MIKVDVISGFLGSGKTTLVKKLLRIHQKEKVVLIENEFGDIGIDGDLMEREGFEVFEISSGCICCIMQKRLRADARTDYQRIPARADYH